MPEKSGMDAAPCGPLWAGPTAGVTVCPQAGTAAADNITNKRKSRRPTFMILLPFMVRPCSFGCARFYPKSGNGAWLFPSSLEMLNPNTQAINGLRQTRFDLNEIVESRTNPTVAIREVECQSRTEARWMRPLG
jgi:hypothetical protein